MIWESLISTLKLKLKASVERGTRDPRNEDTTFVRFKINEVKYVYDSSTQFRELLDKFPFGFS